MNSTLSDSKACKSEKTEHWKSPNHNCKKKNEFKKLKQFERSLK